MVLLSCVIVPARAQSVQSYSIWDHFDDIYTNDNDEQFIHCRFPAKPYFSVLRNGTNIGTGQDNFETDVVSGSTYIYRVFPLGVPNMPGSNISNGVIQVDEFKLEEYFSVTQYLNFEVDYDVHPGASGETSLRFNIYAYACYYDADGQFLEYEAYPTQSKEIVLPNSHGPEMYYKHDVLIDYGFSMAIPENAVYMSPCFIAYFYAPDQSAPHLIKWLRASSEHFSMEVGRNVFLSAKATQDRLDEAIEELERNEEMEKEYLNSWADSTDIMNNAITDFINGKGYNQLSALVVPIMEWKEAGIIMLMVVCFINLSVLFFGR